MRTAARVAVIVVLFLAYALPVYSADEPSMGEGAWLADCLKEYKRDKSWFQRNADEQFKVASCMGYVIAIMQVLDEVQFSIPVGTRHGQSMAVVAKYVEEHPEEWNERAALLIRNALREAFPPKDK